MKIFNIVLSLILLTKYEKPRHHILPNEVPAYILYDYTSDQILYQKNIKKIVYPASITKILTCMVVFDEIKKNNLNLNDEFVVSKKADKTEGTTMFLKENEKVSVENLLKGTIAQSGNDAATTLAEGLFKTEKDFVVKMNQKAQALNMESSKFVNCTGLPDKNHYTSVHDLLKLCKSLISNYPDFYQHFGMASFRWNNITQYNKNSSLYSKKLKNQNIFIDGIKTGYTSMSLNTHTLSGYKQVKIYNLKIDQEGKIDLQEEIIDRRLIGITMGHVSKKTRKIESERLLLLGFTKFNVLKFQNEYKININDKIYKFKFNRKYLAIKSNIELDKITLKIKKNSNSISGNLIISDKNILVAQLI
ncbi:D-alanyl-D-alanine carboxypeptidase [seawater metagenome]|uniref:D-alanyl-D-alanine carboxypeptidase n=1 Tax=seawater metagenome TaxID=1561972 RepID=A0A5E8CJG7_9ZZZZ